MSDTTSVTLGSYAGPGEVVVRFRAGEVEVGPLPPWARDGQPHLRVLAVDAPDGPKFRESRDNAVADAAFALGRAAGRRGGLRRGEAW